MEKLKSENGITLISLAVTVIIMLIISVGITATMTTNIEMKNYNKFKEDIITLSEATKLYYLNNSSLPVSTNKVLTSIDVPSKDKNPNDNNKYYYIDMRLLPDAETYFGAGNKDGTFASDDNDLFVVNEKTLTVYYLKGAVLNGERHYTAVDDFSDGGFASDYYSKTDLPIISAISMQTDGTDSTKARVGDTVTLKFITNYTLTKNPTVIIDGQDVTSSCTWDGNICKVGYKVTSLSDSSGNSKDGKIVEFSISNYSADNRTGTTISSVNFGKSVYFEKTEYNPANDGITIPDGFVYVGGTKDSGLVISDNSVDKEKYKGQTTVGTDLEGNQYVWVVVPKTTEVYATTGLEKTTFTEADYASIETDLKNYTSTYRNGTKYSDTWVADTSNEGWFADETAYNTAKNKMLKSVYENGGFYVGRYEAGIATTGKNRTSNTDKNADGKYTVTETMPIPITQANAYPYTYVTRTQAKNLAEKVKSGNKTSSLMFGVQWDLVLAFMKKVTGTGTLTSNSSTIGNYSNTLWTITNTKAQYSEYDGATFTVCPNPYKKESTSEILLTTGASDKFSVQNIYDIAGNVWEWTFEKSDVGSTAPCTERGGFYYNTGFGNPAAYRFYSILNNSSCHNGFRVSLW